MDIEYVRSRFIKHFDGTTGSVYASPGRCLLYTSDAADE